MIGAIFWFFMVILPFCPRDLRGGQWFFSELLHNEDVAQRDAALQFGDRFDVYEVCGPIIPDGISTGKVPAFSPVCADFQGYHVAREGVPLVVLAVVGESHLLHVGSHGGYSFHCPHNLRGGPPSQVVIILESAVIAG